VGHKKVPLLTLPSAILEFLQISYTNGNRNEYSTIYLLGILKQLIMS